MMRNILRVFFFSLLAFLPSESNALTLSQLESQARVLGIDNGPRQRFSTATIDSYLNEGQRIAVVDAKPIIELTSFALSGGTTYYPLPTDFLQVRRVTRDFLDMKEETPESLANKAGLAWEIAQALPTNFYINFSYRGMIGMYPAPGASNTGTIRVDYYAQATELVNGADLPFDSIPELTPYHYLLAYYAAYRMTLIDGRSDLAAMYGAEFNAGIARMQREALNQPSYRPGASPSIGSSRVGP